MAESPSIRDLMASGELYDPGEDELVHARMRARALTARYNASVQDDRGTRRELLRELCAEVGDGAWIEPPFHCDYGWHITLGERAFLNFGCVVLDCAPVEVGAFAKLAPYVQLCAATHTVDPLQREAGLEYALPIRIGRNVWIGAGVIVGPGVAVGDNSVVGAGSVVLRDVPPNVVAVGNPCRVLRPI